jgi:MoxR-like ATPase
MDRPFLVLATQNPIEQEGTYQLPEAQVDRFMLKTVIDYLKWMTHGCSSKLEGS